MTNKPMLSVERELLEEMLAALKETHSLPAKFYGSTLGDRVRAILQSQNEQADPLAIGTLHRDCDERIVFESSGEIHIKDGMQVYAEPAAQHQGEPVAWVKCSPAWLKSGGDCATAPRICVGREGISHLHPAHSSAEQPAPVAVDDCENHKTISAAYREILKALGGEDMDFSEALIKAGEAVMPKGSPIAVVMPGRMKPEDNPEHPAREWVAEIYNSALDAVARLNGVKP